MTTGRCTFRSFRARSPRTATSSAAPSDDSHMPRPQDGNHDLPHAVVREKRFEWSVADKVSKRPLHRPIRVDNIERLPASPILAPPLVNFLTRQLPHQAADEEHPSPPARPYPDQSPWHVPGRQARSGGEATPHPFLPTGAPRVTTHETSPNYMRVREGLRQKVPRNKGTGRVRTLRVARRSGCWALPEFICGTSSPNP